MNNAWRIFGIIAAFIFVFLFGAVIGGSTMVLYSRSRFQQFQFQRAREQAERQKEQLQRQQERQRETAQAQQLSQQINSLRQQLALEQTRGESGHRPMMAPEQFGPHLMQVFANRLELNSDQQQQVHLLVFDTAEQLRKMSRESGHNTQLAIEHLEDQISALLTPAQRDRFNEMLQRSRDAFERWNEQQQQWRAQQRLEQQGWRQNAKPGQGQHPNQTAKPAPAAAPATPSARPANPPATTPAAPAAAGTSS